MRAEFTAVTLCVKNDKDDDDKVDDDYYYSILQHSVSERSHDPTAGRESVFVCVFNIMKVIKHHTNTL